MLAHALQAGDAEDLARAAARSAASASLLAGREVASAPSTSGPQRAARRRARREGLREGAADDHVDDLGVAQSRRPAPVAMWRPLRRTVSVSQKARTSRMRCEMKTMVTPCALEPAMISPEPIDVAAGERRGRLVEQQDARLAEDRARDLDLLPDGEIELADLVVEVDVVKPSASKCARDRCARAARAGSCRSGPPARRAAACCRGP